MQLSPLFPLWVSTWRGFHIHLWGGVKSTARGGFPEHLSLATFKTMAKLSIKELKAVLTKISKNQRILADMIEAHHHDKEGYSYSPRVFGKEFETVYFVEIDDIFPEDKKKE